MDPAQRKNLIKKRAVIKTRITRIANFVDAFSEGSNLNDIRVRQRLLYSSRDEYNDVQSQLEINDTAEVHDADRESVEELILDIESKMETLLQPTSSVPSPSTASSSNAGSMHEIRLPTISLPKFTGIISEFVHFRDTFQSLVINNHALTDIQRYYYLLSCLSGEPHKLIESLPVTESNFKVAWELIIQRYNNPKLIVDLHVKQLLDLPSVKTESAKDLRILLNQLLSNLRAIEVMEIDVPLHEVLLSRLVLDRISLNLRKQWEAKTSEKKFPCLKDLVAFLENSCQTLELINPEKHLSDKQQVIFKHGGDKSSKKSFVTTAPHCEFCKASHTLTKCPRFREVSVGNRIDFAKKCKLCFNCLGANHTLKECSSGNCRTCNNRHHTLLHKEQSTYNDSTASDTNQTQQQTYCAVKSNYKHVEVLLSTALVVVTDKLGNAHQCRALLDSASQMHFMSRHLADRLGYELSRHSIPIKGISDVKATETSHICQIQVSSRVTDYSTSIVCAVLPRITGQLPIAQLDTSDWQLPKDINLADPQFSTPGEVDLLLGASVFFDILRHGQLKRENHPTIQDTAFGWILSGRIPPHSLKSPSKKVMACLIRNNELHTQVERFWQQEEVKMSLPRSKEENQCEEHFVQNTTRDETGRYVVRLPIKPHHEELGDSFKYATRCLNQIEQRLHRQPDLKKDYVKFMAEYADLHDMELVTGQINKPTYYLPHHPVVKQSSTTTKVRVVFNASAKTTSTYSLNDILMVGPTVQEDLYSIILRFRTHKYAFTADIAKMYRQILVHTDDQDLQRIVWRSSPNEPIQIYRLSTVTYGTSAAPFLATRCLVQLANDGALKYPLASETLRRDFYVDDVLSGADTIGDALCLQQELVELLRNAGFPLRKWCANHPTLLEHIPHEHRESQLPWSLDDKEEGTIKALGLLWHPQRDTFQFVAASQAQKNTPWTKRSVLSCTASIFDPLGLLGPVIIKCKIFLQHLWQVKVDWDQSLPPELLTTWEQLQTYLPSLNDIHISRRVTGDGIIKRYELHGFSDASERAFGACVYLRSIDVKDNTTVMLLSSKSRVAPLKQISLPRLELCGAVLLVRLMDKVKTALNLNIDQNYYWTDSTIVLAWLSGEPASWKTFVGNRVSEIQQLSSVEQWNHVMSQDNPADIISRGIEPHLLQDNQLWWAGPSWLYQPQSAWPARKIKNIPELADIPEQRKPAVCLLVVSNFVEDFVHRFSSWSRMVRVMAFILRYMNNLRLPPSKRQAGGLTVVELQEASQMIIRTAQEREYGKELQDLRLGRPIAKDSKLKSLHPFVDAKQMLRVGGRLEQSQAPYSQKHPIILLPNHHVTKLLVMCEHMRLLHAGPQLLLANIRQRYWIPNGKSVIRHVTHKCLPCYRLKTNTSTQLMGQLPLHRVEPNRPFLNCGVDYGGPLYIKQGTRKSKTKVKCYIALFVCMATKAIHIELVSDLSTEAFIAALRRFTSRRGICRNIYSDNGTTFVGARNELRELHLLFRSQLHQRKVDDFASQCGIQWHFIPPHAPHFGGLWEAGIKSTKSHLKKVAGNLVLTFEELSTLLVQIEACLNSRPITKLSDSPDDYSFLTPGHFLIGEPLTTIPEPDLLAVSGSRLSRWQLLQRCRQYVWKRWSRDYLSQLQQRTKWASGRVNLQPGTLVLLKEDNLPPLVWQTGIAVDTQAGADGLVRVVTIRTSKGTFKRPITKICAFPEDVKTVNSENV